MHARRVAIAVLAFLALAVGAYVFIRGHPGRFPWAFDASRGWRAVLIDRAEGANGLRIHSTTGDRSFAFESHRGRVLFETRDEAAVREFLDLIRIVDAASGDHCLCIGGDEVDILDNGSVVTSFIFKHGGQLRSGQLWSGDAVLTSESAVALSAWFTAHGIPTESPRELREREERDQQARMAAQDTILGADRAAKLRACSAPAVGAALLAEWFPDLTDRIVAAAHIAESLSWADDDPADRASTLVAEWLSTVCDAAALSAAFGRILAEPSPDPRALVWLDEIGGSSLAPLRIRAARVLLASSDARHRQSAIHMLGRSAEDAEASAILVALLPPADADGRPTSVPTREHMLVAQKLVRTCDLSMLPRLQMVVDGAADWGEDREFAELVEARRNPAGVEITYRNLDVLPRTPLQGVVRAADGSVVVGASVRLSLPGVRVEVGKSVDVEVSTETDVSGRYLLDVPVGRKWTLSVVHPAHPALVVRKVDLRAARLPAMDFTLPRERSIRGRVLDPDGLPCAGAKVLADRQSPFAWHDGEATVVTADDGSFALPGFDAEADVVVVEIHAHAPGADHDDRASEEQTLHLRADSPPVELRLGRAR